MKIYKTKRPKSRPRALCLDLSDPVISRIPAPGSKRFTSKDGGPMTLALYLCHLAADTGLPVVVETYEPQRASTTVLNALPDQFTYLPANYFNPTTSQYRKMPAQLNIEPHDLLYIGTKGPADLAEIGLRYCFLDDAVETLREYALSFRHGVLSGLIPLQSETVHTALLPLDLAIGTMDDPSALYDQGYRLFDTVLMIENLIPLSGFAAKSLEKLVSGFAPFLYAQLNSETVPEDVLTAALEKLWTAGGRRIILASETGCVADKEADLHLREAKRHGFEVEITAWKNLLKTE